MSDFFQPVVASSGDVKRIAKRAPLLADFILLTDHLTVWPDVTLEAGGYGRRKEAYAILSSGCPETIFVMAQSQSTVTHRIPLHIVESVHPEALRPEIYTAKYASAPVTLPQGEGRIHLTVSRTGSAFEFRDMALLPLERTEVTVDMLAQKADRSELSNVLASDWDEDVEEVEPSILVDALRKTEQTLTDVEKAQVMENLGRPDMKTFVDMWENRCRFNGKDHYFGKYNQETGFFELNEITDITYEEALQIWALSQHAQLPWTAANNVVSYLFGGLGNAPYMTYSKCRTYFPIFSGGGFTAANLTNTFAGNTAVETLNFVNGYGNALSNSPGLNSAFNGCIKLRKILCNIAFPTVDDNTFGRCQELEYINITTYLNNTTLNFQWSPKLSFESLNLLVTNARFSQNHDPDHTMTLTVKVHPEVYSKLTDETNTEWHALIALAAEKNITFATI